MSRQKKVRCYPNGVELEAVNPKTRERLMELYSHLTLTDLNRIEIALRLRFEAEQDARSTQRAGMWRGTLGRIEDMIKKTRES